MKLSVATLEEIKMYFQECPFKQKKKIHFIGGEVIPIVFHTWLFWHKNIEGYQPHLATPSERVFSVAGIVVVVDKRHCALTAEMINALVFCIKTVIF